MSPEFAAKLKERGARFTAFGHCKSSSLNTTVTLIISLPTNDKLIFSFTADVIEGLPYDIVDSDARAE
jgi:hypothetical protein